ncbi:MAG: sugar phosphate isomerase/epimerase [Gemmataceae bacterium]|nr:sugar phosphate isomerase/epimerase [Gemmataceae bacterium]
MFPVASRREFLKQSAAVAGGLAVAPLAAAAPASQDLDGLFKISLAQWSLHKDFFGKKRDPLQFAAISKKDFGIDAVEYVNQFYKDKKGDDGYLKELKKVADDAGVKSVLIMCDGEGALGDPDEGKRQQAVDNHKRWVEWAKTLGCHSIRVNAQSAGSYDEQLERAADGLRKLSEFSGGMGINTIVENHGGLSSNGEWLAAVMKKVGSKTCGTLPDFGNFRIDNDHEYDRYKGVDELMPFAKGVSAKSHDFDEKGNETHTDYRKMLDIVCNKHKYRGYIGIEYEGGKVGEDEGIKLTKKLLETVRAEMKG